MVLYTDAEVVNFHRPFRPVSSSTLYNILKRTNSTETTPDVQKSIVALTQKCIICAKDAQAPKIFQRTLGHENGRFNVLASTYIMFIKRNPVLHVADEVRHFSAAQMAKVWKFIRDVARISKVFV